MEHINFNTIAKGFIDIWVIDIMAINDNMAFFYTLLSNDERIKANRFKFDKDKKISIVSRGSLRYLIGQYLNLNPTAITFTYGTYGKPQMDGLTALKFNVSHSKRFIVVGFAYGMDLGVDIEYINNTFNVMDIVDNYFSKAEIKAIAKLAQPHERTNAFYRGWSRKEAFIKAKGLGLSLDLHSFSITMDGDETAELYETHWNGYEKQDWHILPFYVHPDYKAAVAVSGEINGLRIVNFFDVFN